MYVLYISFKKSLNSQNFCLFFACSEDRCQNRMENAESYIDQSINGENGFINTFQDKTRKSPPIILALC